MSSMSSFIVLPPRPFVQIGPRRAESELGPRTAYEHQPHNETCDCGDPQRRGVRLTELEEGSPDPGRDADDAQYQTDPLFDSNNQLESRALSLILIVLHPLFCT